MLKNYLKIAVRNLWKHKIFTVINIVGLAVAFGAAILLSFTAFHELSFDDFHTHKSALYELYREVHLPGKTDNNNSFPVPFTPALKAAFPDVARATRFGENGGSILRYNNHEFHYNILSVDPDFLEMFSFPLEKGDKSTALNDLGSIVLTRTVAKSVFGTEEPIGRTIEIKTTEQWSPFIVTGVTNDPPKNSSLEFSGLVRFENIPYYASHKDKWNANNHEVFVQLSPGASQTAFENKVKNFIHLHYDSLLIQMKLDGGIPDKEGELLRVRMIPIADIHSSPITNFVGANKFYPWLLLLIGAFILFIASINFVNLSLGRALTRAREIGIRKVLGAMRKQVLLQFWGEALIICVIALVIGVLLAKAFMPGYKTLFQQELAPGILTSPLFLLSIGCGFGLVSLLAGGYPAWMLSTMKTAQTVKGKITVGTNHRVRNTLMIAQFVISGLLIICTSIVWQQVNYMRSAPLGYNKQQVISIPVGMNIDGEKALTLMRNGLANLPGVLSVSGTDNNMGRGRDNSSSTSIIGFDYKGKTIHSHWQRIDYDYAKTLDLQLVQGRDFSRNFATDSAGALINERMAALLGAKNPLDVVLNLDDIKLRIVGVVKDFNFKSLRQEIAPLTMVIRNDMPISYIFVKVTPSNLPASMDAVQKVWKNINPKAESEISFLDENTDKQYRKEQRLSRIFISGAIMAIVISCMGLFAIIVLVLGQRTKEIGIRKILGASTTNILTLVAKEFLQLVLIATIIASPIAWYLMHQWLQDFAYRIHISVWVFLFSAAIALLIALVTISVETLRTARLNPVDNLKAE
jgi:putative ABC transport system permease protein